MKKTMEVTVNNIEMSFTGGIGNHLFEEVFDDLPNAKIVRIMTYNIEQTEKALLYEKLRNVNSETDFKWVFQLLERNLSYRYLDKSMYIKKFSAELAKTMKIIEPSCFPCKINVSENRHNHAKLFGTENVLYIGSQNFSNGSKNNYELGCIIRDSEKIREIYDCFFNPIFYARDSIRNYPVFSAEYDRLFLEILLTIREITIIFENVCSEDPEYYDSSYLDVCEKICMQLIPLIQNLIELITQLDTVKDEQIEEVENAFAIMEDIVNNLKNDPLVFALKKYNYEDEVENNRENFENRYEDWSTELSNRIRNDFIDLCNQWSDKYVTEIYKVEEILSTLQRQLGHDDQYYENLFNSKNR